MKIGFGPSSRFLLLMLLGACSRRTGSGGIAERYETDGPAASPAGSVPGAAPSFPDPVAPPQGTGPYEHPFLRDDGHRRDHAIVGDAEISGGTVTNADRVVAGMRAGFRACYHRGLASDPEQRGSLRITAKLDAYGGVINATADRAGHLSQETTDCVLRRVQAATFAAPVGGQVSVIFSITFDKGPLEPGDGGSFRG